MPTVRWWQERVKRSVSDGGGTLSHQLSARAASDQIRIHP